MPEITLPGCTPEPLMSYLKALGILRLVAEQKDPEAKGCWGDGFFTLRLNLDERSLLTFFLDQYSPTPIIAPWNGGSGFYLKWDDNKKVFKRREAAEVIGRIAGSASGRLRAYGEAITAIKQTLGRMGSPLNMSEALEGKTKKQKKDLLDGVLVFEVGGDSYCLTKAGKDEFLARLRSLVLDEVSLRWLDAALALTVGRKKNRIEAPLLGSGGNVGNSDFSAMFAQMILYILPSAEEPDPIQRRRSETLLSDSLLGRPVSSLLEFPIGQFDPGKAGGANQSQGFDAAPSTNPWDYVLMCEGALVLAGSISRRTETGPTGASFPFTVKNSLVGYGSAGADNSRGETWLPLWRKPTSASEVTALFSEGRAELGERPARSGVDFVRAIAMLGVDRGISGFLRYGYQERLGQSYLATSLGRFDVHARPDVDLVREVDPWLDRFRRAASDDEAPPRFKSALRRIEAAIFGFCQYGGPSRFGEILCALGQAERELSTGEKYRKDKFLTPLCGLSPAWLGAADDLTAEFGIALALSGLWDRGQKVEPLRANLEPAQAWTKKEGGSAAKWTEAGNAVVWTNRDLASNLSAILERRLLDGNRQGCMALPLSFHRGAPLAAISAFIHGETDDERIAELLWGMILIDHNKPYPALGRLQVDAPPLPRAFAMLRLLYLPHGIEMQTGEISVKPEARVLGLLRSGRMPEACAIAGRRLRASGLNPMPHAKGTSRDDEWKGALGAVSLSRLAAALLIPVSYSDMKHLVKLVLRPETMNEEAIR